MRRNRRPVTLSRLALLTLAIGCGSDAATPTPDARDVALADASSDGDAAPESPDAASAAWSEGIAGETCAAGWAAVGKTCATVCTDHRSCGSHDGVAPPYAGYACYYWENEDHTFRSNDGRSFTSCDDPVTETWDNFGDIEQLGDYLGGNPVSCCCE